MYLKVLVASQMLITFENGIYSSSCSQEEKWRLTTGVTEEINRDSLTGNKVSDQKYTSGLSSNIFLFAVVAVKSIHAANGGGSSGKSIIIIPLRGRERFTCGSGQLTGLQPWSAKTAAVCRNYRVQ